MTGDGFEIEVVNARDEAALYLRCLLCGWEGDLGCEQVLTIPLEKISRLSDAHEYECTEIR